jgi:integrase/recombinase XerD
MSLIAPTVEAFFTERLITQRNASPRTIAAYRDTLRLLLRFASEQTAKQPCRLEFADLDAPRIGAFLNHLEGERGNSITTRNARLAAIHSLYRYATLRHPEEMATIARVIEIPAKRHKRTTISYLEEKEIKALLRAPDRSTWLGRRDHALLLTAIQTGLRVSELASLRVGEVSLDTGAHCRVLGKGRKERCATLTAETVAVLRTWLAERQGEPNEPLFPSRRGGQLTQRRSPGCSTSTSPPRRAVADRCAANVSLRTCSGTPTRCCCAPATSTSSRSRCGWATKAPNPPRSTCTPTTSSNSGRSNAPLRPALHRADARRY